MKRAKKGEQFRLLQFRWLFLVNTIIVVGAVLSFGIVAFWGLHMDETNAIIMLGMIPPMVLALGLSTAIIMHSIRKKMGALLDGIQTVANGDLSVRLETKGAEEYEALYDSFNRMTQELRNTKEEMQNFMNDFSHEFKTPITSIHGFAEFLVETGEGVESPERMKYLQIIADESMRLSELSQKTLLLSKVEACEIITDKERYDLTEQIKRCAILLLPQIERKKIALALEIPDILYYGNAELMEQIWINLLSNAIRYTPENGEITISAQAGSGQISIAFADNGIGMDKETAAHIFEKYYQGKARGQRGGNGIGLSIVHRIVMLCGGTVEVSSAPDEGSVFTVHLPQETAQEGLG